MYGITPVLTELKTNPEIDGRLGLHQWPFFRVIVAAGAVSLQIDAWIFENSDGIDWFLITPTGDVPAPVVVLQQIDGSGLGCGHVGQLPNWVELRMGARSPTRWCACLHDRPGCCACDHSLCLR